MLEMKQLRKLSKNLVAEPDNYIHSFRKNLDMYISQKEITLAELAELADLPLSTLRSFVYGDSKDCHVSTVVKLARVLGVSCDELLGSGTISPQTCESLQLVRQLPESFTHFVRWAIHYHYAALTSARVSERAVEIMAASVSNAGNLVMTNDFDIIDISCLSDEIRPKIFMGIRIPTNDYLPNYSEGDILLIANDRIPRPTEHVIIHVAENMWIVNRKAEKNPQTGEVRTNFYSIRDGINRGSSEDTSMIIGYVVKVLHPTE